MPICEMCKKRPATVHITEVSDNREVHLCADCARKQGEAPAEPSADETLELLAKFSKTLRERKRKEEDVPVCERCGTSLSDFEERGRLGCPEGYHAFREQLNPILERVHGRPEHTGKRLAESEEDARRRQELTDLNRRLQDAVNREAYEDAAALRDRIAELRGASPEE